MRPRRGERTRDDNAEELSDRYEGVNAGLSDVPALADAAAKPQSSTALARPGRAKRSTGGHAGAG
jgi:hypothetical protein